MTDTLSISAVSRRAKDIIEALDATDYKQGPILAKWTRMRSFMLWDEAASVVHLRFHAGIENSPSDSGHRGSPYGTEQVESSLVVSFAYHLVPGEHDRDIEKAYDAAQDVAKAINRDERGDWSPRFRAISSTVDVEKGIALMAVSFGVIHNIEV